MNITYQNISIVVALLLFVVTFALIATDFLFFYLNMFSVTWGFQQGFCFWRSSPSTLIFSSSTCRMVCPQNRENLFIKPALELPDLIITLITLAHHSSLTSSEWRYYYIWDKPAFELPDLLITLIAAVFLHFLHLPLKVKLQYSRSMKVLMLFGTNGHKTTLLKYLFKSWDHGLWKDEVSIFPIQLGTSALLHTVPSYKLMSELGHNETN